MELLDTAKDRRFLMKSVINKWVDVSTFLKERKTKNLNRNDLDEIAEELNNFFINHGFIEFMNIACMQCPENIEGALKEVMPSLAEYLSLID